MRKVENYTVNFGPQHPAAHGVLRLVLELSGEQVKGSTVHVGLLHRGSEKLMEGKSYKEGLPYMDRLDYVSMMCQEHTYVLGIEKLKGIEVCREDSYRRMIMLELTRILNHLLAISCHALDVGAMTAYFYGFEEREKIMEYYERVSGGRMHAAYIVPGGVREELTEEMLEDIGEFMRGLEGRLDEMEGLLSKNRIWEERLKGIGVLPWEYVRREGYTGVMLRGSGVDWDLRRDKGYERYEELSGNWEVVVGEGGDCYSRYKVRMGEMRNSIKIVLGSIEGLEGLGGKRRGEGGGSKKGKEWGESMEGVIRKFKGESEREEEGEKERGMVYVGTETPKGELGVHICGGEGEKGRRIRIRSPGYYHLGGLERMSKGHYLADIVTIIGTLDIVFGEIDR